MAVATRLWRTLPATAIAANEATMAAPRKGLQEPRRGLQAPAMTIISDYLAEIQRIATSLSSPWLRG